MFHPASILLTWIFGLISLAIPVAGGWLIWNWFEQSHVLLPIPTTSPASASEYRRVFDPDFGANAATALLALGITCLLWAAGGGRLLLRAFLARGTRDFKTRQPVKADRIQRPDGTEIEYEMAGHSTGPTIVLTHGLGMDRNVWREVVSQFATRYRFVTWDLPGMGRSKKGRTPYSVAKLADDLAAVLRRAADEGSGAPVIAVGHSLGGMLNLELHREPERRNLTGGIVQVHTTFTNPLRTMKGGRFFLAIQTAVIKPLLYASIALSPLIRLMNLLSYLNGSAHLSTWRESFAGKPTFEMLDFAARYIAISSPANLGRINLALLEWDAAALLDDVAVSALVIAADKDGTCLPEASHLMADQISGADLFTLTPAKHLGLLEHHANFCQGLGKFVQGLRVQSSLPT